MKKRFLAWSAFDKRFRLNFRKPQAEDEFMVGEDAIEGFVGCFEVNAVCRCIFKDVLAKFAFKLHGVFFGGVFFDAPYANFKSFSLA